MPCAGNCGKAYKGFDTPWTRLAKLREMVYASRENWSFPGLSEANLCVLEPRGFTPKLTKFAQGFPNLGNNSQGPTQLHSFKSP
jgi:hypothetical protein